MNLRILNLLIVLGIGLSACGSTPEPVNMDRRYLAGEYLEQEKEKVLAAVAGEVLDYHEWTLDEQKVFTILSRETEPDTGFQGVFLRQYDLSGQFAELMWTYQDSVACTTELSGADAGAVYVTDKSPALRPALISGDAPQQFLLHYQLGCSESEKGNNLVVVNALTGTPDVRLFGRGQAIEEATGLRELSEDTIRQLMAVWG